jgi:hypothetical protein
MVSNLYLQSKFLVTINSIKEWKGFDKSNYIRFRINYSLKDGGVRAERCLNRTICDYVQDDFNFYSTFITGSNIIKPYYNRVEEFLVRNKITIIRMIYGHLAGFIFPDKKTKELFLLKYSDMFPVNCIIK